MGRRGNLPYMIGIDLSGKTALVMGVTNSYSLGWAIGEKLLQAGAKCIFSYQGERLKPALEKLLAPYEGTLTGQCDVTNEAELESLFAQIKAEFGSLDYIVHAVAYAPRASMEGRFVDTTQEDWNTALSVSAYSLVSVARHAEPLLNEGGSIVTLTYYASQKVVPKYNVMGIAKAALEASTRYLAYELGSKNVRVNAISAGPMRTVAAKSIPGFTSMLSKAAEMAALKRNATSEEVGKLGLFLLSDLSSGITGETTYVDAGYNIMGMSFE
ncbi:enoyl-[acyl-carrier-protein] reductase [NADH] [Deinococcus cellulosilyticus NBRC 106333 = KACC 11606]|uniref:Enoyl-[acyl-carrier-protein] reductase [NADH] n=2 Tax=Deinococcus cellulosilyticus TaxID=401558 RepID=A0A511N011_DEIC1|nr:enoyl-[acyl-carrier-protein] reductase [NADH] [Deinococcus cellulosilyticus NBRC 106333 = KACC 11606]